MQRGLKILAFFLLGAAGAGFTIATTAYLTFTISFRDKVYPGVKIAGVDFSGQRVEEMEKHFQFLSPILAEVKITITSSEATISARAKDLKAAYDHSQLARRAFSIGRQTKNPYHNLLQILAASRGEIDLPLEVVLDREVLEKEVDKIAGEIEKRPRDAVYKFSPGIGPDGKGRVTAFRASENGRVVDRDRLYQIIKNRLRTLAVPESVSLTVPTKIVAPVVSSTTADELGIKDLLGRGETYFYDSITGRVYNIALGTEKISGSLIAPRETFSFSNAIGTVSAVFGFQKAYSIVKGKTVLDDGGGVCQVSTTLYRAALNSGLPVVERVAHSYRVGFYEQGGFLPGLDATVYPPAPDFKFKNDTGNWLLLQATFDRERAKLTFEIFGTSDGRKTEILGPYFISTSPPPDPVYEDDPALPAGQVKQVDTAHPGAKVYFLRKVVRGNEVIVDERVNSDYIPWPARFLKGTKTN